MKKSLLASYIYGIRDLAHGESYSRLFRYFFPEFITALALYSAPYIVDALFIADLKSTSAYARQCIYKIRKIDNMKIVLHRTSWWGSSYGGIYCTLTKKGGAVIISRSDLDRLVKVHMEECWNGDFLLTAIFSPTQGLQDPMLDNSDSTNFLKFSSILRPHRYP